MRLNRAWLAIVVGLGGCGPNIDVASDDEGSSGEVGEASTVGTDTGVEEGSSTPGDSGSGETGSLPACPAPEVLPVTLEVTGLDDFQGLFEAKCVVADTDLSDQADSVALDCQPADGTAPVSVRIAFGNAAVLLPAAVIVGAEFDLAYGRAAYEYSGQWVTLREPEGDLVLGIASGGTPIPQIEGTIEDFYAPFSVSVMGGRCPKETGSCFALGEPAYLRFEANGEALELAPLQVEQLAGFTVHTGHAWLSDPDSQYNCDGPSDDWAAFILGVP